MGRAGGAAASKRMGIREGGGEGRCGGGMAKEECGRVVGGGGWREGLGGMVWAGGQGWRAGLVGSVMVMVRPSGNGYGLA